MSSNAIVNVTSDRAFMPSALTPAYCATKAALHSYPESLRFQLCETSVQVIEIVPPQVQTALPGADIVGQIRVTTSRGPFCE